MNYKKLPLLLAFITPSICLAESSYDAYKDSVKNCIEIENQKAPVTISDLHGLKPEDIDKYLLLLKDIRIQECSKSYEMEALVNELSSGNELINIDTLSERYLSIYIKKRTNTLSENELSKLNQLDSSLKEKSLEVNMLSLWEKLKDN
ncbi:hypothetical protein DSL61_16365 [Vibrio cholerae]|uniref:hypothetical protein n=1 Tax=Vibrio cholerae TaxID=666 RepID=UPI000DE27677|nr:hypothetical protein [Vibrio cholerae]RBO14612.1 hypothetical protein DSL61_16365 [Vibrio cholerae]